MEGAGVVVFFTAWNAIDSILELATTLYDEHTFYKMLVQFPDSKQS